MIDHSVLCSSQDHLKTGMRDLDHHVSCRCKKTGTTDNVQDVCGRYLLTQPFGYLACIF
jgi:hypothetical protein